MADPDLEPARVDPRGLAHELARADLKARLFGAPAESTRIGRYAVLRRLGSGGMGVVYVAYDEQLDRKIAVKLVHPGDHDPSIAARSRREAQALARLSHPNVVQVYEVGEYQGQVYLAMEFVPGQTLRAWQAQAPRSWRDTVAMYLQAGRGLAAAHARGLVHRDFKPENVLVGDDDQRPRVLDFGLARAPGGEADMSQRPGHDLTQEPAYPSPRPAPSPAADDAGRLTTPGAVLGTPAYMAPEQLDGGDADPRSDLFSFCAALHEALHGVRPFTADDPAGLRAAIARGAPHRAVDLPGWLQRVIDRGLAAAPADRWPAMEPLLAALARDPTRWRRRVVLTGLGLGLVGLGLHGALLLGERQQQLALAEEQARAAAATAELRRTEAARAQEQRRAEARALATRSELHADTDPVVRLLLAVEAVALHTRAGSEPIVEAEQALLDALDGVRSTPFLRPGAGFVDAVAESPDGRWLATGERDGALTLWRVDDPRTPHPLHPGDGHPVHGLAFSPDSTQLAATRARDHGALVWRLPEDSPNKPAPEATPDRPTDIPKQPVPKDIHKQPVPKDTPDRPTDITKQPVLKDTHKQPVPKDTPDRPIDITRQPVPKDTSPPPPARWPGPPDLRDLDWSPDSSALLARAGSLAVILRPASPALELRGHTGPVRKAIWSPDAASIATASADGTARIWPARGGPPRVLGDPGGRGLWSVDWSPDGRELALASADHTATIVPLRGRPLRLRGHTGEVYSAGFTRDGARLVTVAMDDTARVWERDGSSARIPLPGHADVLGGVRLGPDRDLLLGTPPGGAAWLWQIDRPGPPLVLHGHRGSVVAARFSADGRRLLTASADGSARLWRFADDPDVLRGHDAGIEHAGFAPDGRSIVTASMDGTTRVWPRTGDRPIVLRGHREGSSIAAAHSPDSQRLASAGTDGLARLWSLTTTPPTLLATLPAEPERGAPLLDLQWSPDGRSLALAADDGRIHLVQLTPDGRPETAQILRGHTGPVRVLTFNNAGDQLASAGDDAQVRLWRVRESPVSSDIFTGHTMPVRALAFAPDVLLSAGDDAVARVWPLSATTPPQLLQGHLRAIWQISARPHTDAFVTASADASARVWPVDGGPPIVLGGHVDAVWIAAPSPDGRHILTISADGTARLWRLRDGVHDSLLLSHRGASGPAPDDTLWTGGFSPDGRHILTAGADGLARVFPVALTDQLAEACARAGRNLDADEWTRLVGARPREPSCPDLPRPPATPP